MNKPQVSVILPTYNRGDMICRAVESVFGQSFKNFECVIIDDGSTDDTLERLSVYSDERLKIIRQENRGVSAARNVAIAESCGSFIALLDSDDEWDGRKLEKQLAFMEAEGLDISQTNEIWVRKGKRVNQCRKYEKPEGFFFERSLSMCLVSPSCVMFSRKFWEDVGPFDENMLACEDYDMWLRAGLKYPVGLLQERLTTKYGGRPDQLTNSVACLDIYRIYAIIKLLVKGELPAEERSAALVELQLKAGYFVGGCRKRGKEEQAARVEQLVQAVVQGDIVSPAAVLG